MDRAVSHEIPAVEGNAGFASDAHCDPKLRDSIGKRLFCRSGDFFREQGHPSSVNHSGEQTRINLLIVSRETKRRLGAGMSVSGVNKDIFLSNSGAQANGVANLAYFGSLQADKIQCDDYQSSLVLGQCQRLRQERIEDACRKPLTKISRHRSAKFRRDVHFCVSHQNFISCGSGGRKEDDEAQDQRLHIGPNITLFRVTCHRAIAPSGHRVIWLSGDLQKWPDDPMNK